MHPLTQRISELTSKARRVALGAAAGRLTAVVVGVALVLMGADYLMRLTDPGMRWLSAAVLTAAAAAAAYRWLTPRAWRSITQLSLAQQIQTKWPTLGSRLASAVEFLGQRQEDPSAGSNDLRRSVVLQVTSEVDSLDLNQVIDRRRLRRALQTVAACVLGFVAFGAFDPGGLQTAAARLLTPWQDKQWPRQNHLVVVDAPDRIARSQAFQANIQDTNDALLPADLRVQYRMRVGSESRVEEQLLPATGREAALLRENVQQAFAFRVLGGDDLSMPWRNVQVVDPPRIDGAAYSAIPPSYSGLSQQALLDQDRVLAGSQLQLIAETSEPLVSATLEITFEGQPPTLVPVHVTQQPQSSVSSLQLESPYLLELPADKAVTASCRLRLESKEGLVGHTAPMKLQIEPDPAPKLEWLAPTRELLVTNQAVVPIRVLAEDNLAIAQAHFLWRREAISVDDDSAEPVRTTIYQGPTQPPVRSSPVWSAPADSRELGYALELSKVELAPGDQLAILAQARDFRPGIGTTPLPQRITIISEEEFDSRLAEKQSDLMQDLQRLLAQQRETRQGAGELEIERDSGQPVDRATLDRLATLGFEQLRINEGVSNPARGAVRQAKDLLNELKMNQQARPELSGQLNSIRDELDRLSAGPLASASRELADARRAAQQAVEEASQATEEQVDQSLADATDQQDHAIESIESLVDRMADWSSYQRFAQELAELEDKQRTLREETLKEATRAAAAKPGDRERAAAREKLRAAQGELSRRLGKLLDSMRRAAATPESESSSSTQSLKDALSEARDRDTAGRLREAERQLSNGQLGLSAREQQQGVEDLKELLDILRDRASADPGRLAQQLEKAQQKLRELQKELDELQDKADKPGQQRKREGLADKAERMGRRLNRLDAPQAGQSAQQGAGQMQQSADQGQQGQQKLDDAEQSLQQAQEQLAERIKQLKDVLALRVLERLAARMDAFIARQNQILEGTIRVEQEHDAGIAAQDLEQPIKRLSTEQTELREDVEVARRNVAEREVFELALQGAVDQMDRAVERLADQLVDRPTQQREYDALVRLKHISDALKINPPEPEEEEQQQGGGGQGGGQSKPPSPIDLAELKMLRMIQLDLNAQTRNFEAEAADQNLSQEQAKQEAGRLSEEQKRLGDLVRELIERNNKPPPQPGALPDDAV